MAARAPAAASTPAAKKASSPAKKAARKRAQPADKPPNGADKPVKLARRGRKPTAGAKFRRAIDWKDAPADAELLITRGARLADRLEQLGRLLDGEPDAWLAVKVSGTVLSVDVSGAAAEERQLSEVLRKVIMGIHRLRGPAKGKQPGDDAGPADPVLRIVSKHYGERRHA